MSGTGAHFYEVYETKDRRHVAVGAIEPQFYAELLRGLELDATSLPAQMDRSSWPEMKRRLAEIFRTRTRDDWERVFSGKDACVSPVLAPSEAARHPHAVARGSFCEPGGVLQPGPVPALQQDPGSDRIGACHPGSDCGLGACRLGRRCAARRRSQRRGRAVVTEVTEEGSVREPEAGQGLWRR